MTLKQRSLTKIFSTLFFVCLFSLTTQAGEIKYANFLGVYHLKVEVLNKKALYILTIRPAQVFEVTRQYDDGHLGQICNGTYNLEKVKRPPLGAEEDLIMKGTGSCPSNRSEIHKIEINMKNATTRDLEHGTNVDLYSSEAGVTLQAKMKKQ